MSTYGVLSLLFFGGSFLVALLAYIDRDILMYVRRHNMFTKLLFFFQTYVIVKLQGKPEERLPSDNKQTVFTNSRHYRE